VALEGMTYLAQRQIPNEHQPILGAGGQELTVRGELQARDPGGMPLQGALKFGRIDPHEVDIPAGGDGHLLGVAGQVEAGDRGQSGRRRSLRLRMALQAALAARMSRVGIYVELLVAE